MFCQALKFIHTFRNRKYYGRKTELGEIRIFHSALKDLILQGLIDLPQLKKIRIRIKIKEQDGGLGIRLFCGMMDNSDFASLALKVRDKVVYNMQTYAGITVKEVKVLTKSKEACFSPKK